MVLPSGTSPAPPPTPQLKFSSAISGASPPALSSAPTAETSSTRSIPTPSEQDLDALPEDPDDLRAHIRRSALHTRLVAEGSSWAASVRADLDRLTSAVQPDATPFLTPARPDLPVGGRMQHFATLWAALLDDPFSSSVCAEGVVPHLKAVPRFRGPSPLRPLDADERHSMRTMLQELLGIRVIRRLSADEARSAYIHPDTSSGFWVPPKSLRPVFSTYFLIPKKDGGHRGCLDLRYVNEHVICPSFRMETLRHLKSICRPSDYMCSLDVRHAYLHFPLHPAYRQLHRFAAPDPNSADSSAGFFEFNSMTFGLSSSPLLYTRLMRPIAALLRQQYGIRFVFYLDDWCILGRDADECARHTAIVARCLQQLGFLLHEDKCQLTPVQHGPEFLGMCPDLRPSQMVIRLPARKRRDIRRACARLLSSPPSALFSSRQLSRVLGKMVAARDAVQHGMLRARSLQRLQQTALATSGWDLPSAALSLEARADLTWWVETCSCPTACQIKLMEHEVTLDHDASPWGWGAFLADQPAGGLFTPIEARRSQNARELTGLVYSLKAFETELTGKCVLVQTDNTTVMTYVNREGGRSRLLSRTMEDLLKWCAERSISLRACHLPGKLNDRADAISRRTVDRSECSLHPRYVRQVEQHFGPLTCDLFAGRHNSLCPRFFSPMKDFEAAATDAFRQDWSLETNPIANPPFAVLPRVLQQTETQRARILLVAPVWGSTWWPLLMEMCSQPPLLLPQAADLFLLPDGSPSPPPRWRTAVFALDGALAGMPPRHRHFRKWTRAR